MLHVSHLTIKRGEKTVINDVSFSVGVGELVVIQGQNGSGKSTLLEALMGHPGCERTGGSIRFLDDEISELLTFERTKRGIFFMPQNPPALAGVTLAGLVRASIEARTGQVSIPEVQGNLRAAVNKVGLDESFLKRYVHEGSSGGEKKRVEMIQLLLAKPKLALLDEPDSGLDPAARENFVKCITDLRKTGTVFVVISHSEEFTRALQPTEILRMESGKLSIHKTR